MTKLEAEPLPHLQQSQVIRWPRQRLPTNREAAVPSGVGKDSQGWLFELDRETDEKKAFRLRGNVQLHRGWQVRCQAARGIRDGQQDGTRVWRALNARLRPLASSENSAS